MQPMPAVVQPMCTAACRSASEKNLCSVKMLHFSGVPGSVRLTRAGSVAAVRSLSQTAASGSASAMVLPTLFDIFVCPSSPRIFGVVENSGSGSANVSPNRALKRRTISRASSRCWRWSSPTGTRVAP